MKQETHTLNRKIDEARMLVEGIYNHLPGLDSMGLTSDYMLRLEEARLKVEKTMATRARLESERRSLIGKLREQTRYLDAVYAWGRHTITGNLPRTTWLTFGIDADLDIHE